MSDPDDDDEEALTWAGARDPSLYETPEPKVATAPAPKRPAAKSTKSATAPDVAAAPGDVDKRLDKRHDRADEDDEDDEDDADDADDADDVDDADDRPAPMSSVVLVCLGVLGGLFALYTAGWFVSWLKLVYSPSDALELGAFRVQQVLAILAPPVWFVAVVFLTRRRRAALRLLWLVIGAILLVPWPWILER